EADGKVKSGLNEIDRLIDGPVYGRPIKTRLSAGKPLIDFGEGIHLNKQLDNIADGATYGRPLKSRLNAGKPVIDFTESIHTGKNLDNIDNTPMWRKLGGGYGDEFGRVTALWDGTILRDG